MAEKVLITESKLTAIGAKLRSKLAVSDLYTLDEMPPAIDESGYKVKGDYCLEYLKYLFSKYVDSYIDENGLYIKGRAVTRSELEDYLLNRDNCKYHGKLEKYNKYLVDENGVPVEIRGIGTHALTQYDNLHTEQAIETLKYLGVNCIRMSAYLQNHKFSYSDGLTAPGYIPSPDALKVEMDKIIGYCVDIGLYVIVDWHVWSGGGEHLNTSDAVGFFTYFANKYHNVDNVLYELANEPFSDSLADIVAHISTLRTLIKGYVTNPVLISGVRNSSNGVMELYNALQAENIDDVFISQHRYTGDESISTFEGWWENDIPLFITEWSNTSSSIGTQSEMNIADGNAFMNFFHTECVPHCIWKYTDQTMAYSVLGNMGSINHQFYKYGGFLENELSTYGRFMFGKFAACAFEDHIDRHGIVPGHITHTITKVMPYATDSNAETEVVEQTAYSNVITPDSGYTMFSASVKMGGNDITSTAVTIANGVCTISIAPVTGDIEIESVVIPEFSMGTINAQGADQSNTNRIRSGFIPENISTIHCPEAFQFTILCHTSEGVVNALQGIGGYYNFNTGNYDSSGKFWDAGDYDLTDILEGDYPKIRIIARNVVDTTDILPSDGAYFFSGGTPFTKVNPNWENDTFTFSSNVVLTTSNNGHIKLEFPQTSASNDYFINVSKPSANTSNVGSSDNVNNKSDTFISLSASDIVRYQLKNFESTMTSSADYPTKIDSNMRKQNASTSILSTAVSIKHDDFADAEQYQTMSSDATSSCVLVYMTYGGGHQVKNGTIEFDIVIDVYRR